MEMDWRGDGNGRERWKELKRKGTKRFRSYKKGKTKWKVEGIEGLGKREMKGYRKKGVEEKRGVKKDEGVERWRIEDRECDVEEYRNISRSVNFIENLKEQVLTVYWFLWLVDWFHMVLCSRGDNHRTTACTVISLTYRDLI